MEAKKYDAYSASIGYNNALDDFAQHLKKILKQKKEKDESITLKDVDFIRKNLRLH